MNIVIIEDETAAAKNLARMIASVAPEAGIAEILESVEESIEYFGQCRPEIDLVFMDIHLADGDSFRIFDHVAIDAPIIFTTAYDQYALQAFKVNSIDYLLKPFQEQDLRRALDKPPIAPTDTPASKG